ncbi:methyl-accepting chemotaxis protein [Caldifermentibacillus hisashii]|uniref:methyl-accepting chemotaxis protein n=1 Tax=Caldifermentibacillus hisashii TaxID=996558 RepID=UPI0034D4A638
MKFLKKSLKNKLLFTISIFIIFIFAVLTVLQIHQVYQTLDNDLEKELKSVGILTAMQLDPKDLSKLEKVKNGKDKIFIENQKLLDKILKQQGTMSWSYIWKIDGDDVFTIGFTSNLNEIYKAGEKFDNLAEVHLTTAKAAIKSGQAEVTPIFEDPYGSWRTVFVPLKDSAGEIFGVIGIDYSADYINQIVLNAIIRQVIVAIAGLVILLLALQFTISRLFKPLNKLVSAADKVAKGDLSSVQFNATDDEIGKLSFSIQKMIHNLQRMITNIRNTSNQLAESSEQLSANSNEAFQFSNMVSNEIEKVAGSSEATLKTTKECAQAIDESAQGIQKIAESASSVADNSAQVSNEAKKGNEVVQNLINQMNLISQSVDLIEETIGRLNNNSKRIIEFVNFITEVADQTNLLALNAAIEAARAGEHGKGFAVVAEEVRKLAEQSANSAGEISQLIQIILEDSKASVEATAKGKENVNIGHTYTNEAGKLFGRILSSIEAVAAQIQEISAASQQMSAATEEVAASVSDMEQMAEQSAEYSKNVTMSTKKQLQSMETIEDTSTELGKLSEQLQVLIKEFKLEEK